MAHRLTENLINALIVVRLMTTVALMQVLKKNALGTISIAGQEYQVYLGECEVNTINMECGRGIDGMLRRGKIVSKRKFTLIEV